MSGFGAIMQGVDVGMQLWSAQKAREYGRRMQIQNQDWLERMSNTAVSRHVADLKRADLNPMLAIAPGGQSSTPSSQPAPTFENYKAGSVSGPAAAQTAVSMAHARLLTAEAKIKESQVPHSAASASLTVDKLSNEVVRLGQDIEKVDIDIQQARLTQEQFIKMAPLLEKAQKLVNEGLRLGLSKKDLESEIATMFKIPFDRAGEAIQYLNELGSKMGTGAADVQDLIRGFPERLRDWARSRPGSR